MMRKLFLNLKFFVIISLILSSQLLLSCADDEEIYPTEINGIEFHDIVIVGGGISGLTCGHYLNNKKGFLILEKNSKVGGRAVSGIHNNFTYAKGAEYLGEPEDYLATMIKKLNLKTREIPSPMDAYFDGTEFYYGCDGLNRYMVSGSSVNEYKRFIRLLLDEYKNYDDVPYIRYTSHARNLDYTSALQWLRDNGFPDRFIKKYNVASRGLFGASLAEISALSFIPEAAFDFDEDDYKEVTDKFDIANEYKNATKENSESYTFTRGLTELTDKLGEVLANKIRLNSTVTEVKKEGNYYAVLYTNKDGEAKTVLSNKVVLAIPSPLATEIAPTLITGEKKDIINQIEYSSYATVALFSKTPIFTKAFDLAVPDGYFFTDIYDGTWVERHYDTNKSPDTYIISAYIAPQTYKDHSLNVMSDTELLSHVYEDLDKIFPGASSKITGHDIEHFPYAYPVMTTGAYDSLLRLNSLNKGTLLLAGDGMIYPTFESAVESGCIAAETLIEGK